MKATMSNLKRIASKHGATVEIDNHDGDSKSIQVIAPDGKQWASGNCLQMVGPYWLHAPESKGEAIADLLERIELGLEDLDEELNG